MSVAIIKCVRDSIFVVTRSGHIRLDAGDEQEQQVQEGQYVAYDGVGLALGVFDTIEQATQAQINWCKE
jgi:hypothetical protein